jgi:hypothetical protein
VNILTETTPNLKEVVDSKSYVSGQKIDSKIYGK